MMKTKCPHDAIGQKVPYPWYSEVQPMGSTVPTLQSTMPMMRNAEGNPQVGGKQMNTAKRVTETRKRKKRANVFTNGSILRLRTLAQYMLGCRRFMRVHTRKFVDLTVISTPERGRMHG